MAVEPRSPEREVELAEHGRGAEHRVIGAEKQGDITGKHQWDVGQEAEEGVRPRADHDRHGSVGAPLVIAFLGGDHMDEKRRFEVEDLVDILADYLAAVYRERFASPSRVQRELLEVRQ